MAAWPNRRQATALSWIYFAYVCCYLVRKNYPLLLPALAARGLLSTAEAGVVASVFEIVVGAVKFFCGVFVDRAPDAGRLLARCLAVAGAACLAMQGVFWGAAAPCIRTMLHKFQGPKCTGDFASRRSLLLANITILSRR